MNRDSGRENTFGNDTILCKNFSAAETDSLKKVNAYGEVQGMNIGGRILVENESAKLAGNKSTSFVFRTSYGKREAVILQRGSYYLHFSPLKYN